MKLGYRVIGFTCLAGLAGCHPQDKYDYVEGRLEPSGAQRRKGETPGVTTVTGADVNRVSNESSIDRIASARCAREASCNNVGPDKHFGNASNCSGELRSKMGEDLNASECPRGIDARELDECLAAIRAESCSNPIESISRLGACRTGKMCLKLDERNR